MSIGADGSIHGFWSAENELFRFLSLGLERILHKEPPKKITIDDFNRLYYTCTQEYPKLQIHFSLCIDLLIPEILEYAFGEVKKQPQLLDGLLAVLASGRPDAAISGETLMTQLVQTLILRYELNERQEAINVIHSSGIERFARERQIEEIQQLQTGIQYGDDLMKKQLLHIRERLGANAKPGNQIYYILKHKEKDPDSAAELPALFLPKSNRDYCAYIIFRGHLTFLLSPKTDLMLSAEVTLEDEAFSKDFYDDITNKMLDPKQRESAAADVMTDKDAEAFLDSLIEKLTLC
jgi:hypothetical protein